MSQRSEGGMRDLLERVSEVMPEGWRLVRGQYRWNLYNYPGVTDPRPEDFPGGFSYDEWIDDSHGDIGLSPLTALLKQGLPDEEMPERDYRGWWDFQGTMNWPTEFEAVANAYLAIKEPK